MKALILAAVLALTPTIAVAQTADDAPITRQELEQRAVVCMRLMQGEITADQVVNALQLDTVRKQRDFALQCQMFLLGIEAGQSLTNQGQRV